MPSPQPADMIGFAMGKEESEMLREHLTEALRASGAPPEIVTLIISMLPIVELRGSIPWALTLGSMEWESAYFLSNSSFIPYAFAGVAIRHPHQRCGASRFRKARPWSEASTG